MGNDIITTRRALLAAALGGCARLDAPLPMPLPADAPTVWLVSFGWHTEVVAPWPAEAALPPPFPRPGLLGLAFGARDYFPLATPGSADLLTALVPGPATILAVPWPAPPAAGADAVALRVAPAGLLRLARFVAADLARDAAGAPVVVAPGFRSGGVFLAASRGYAPTYTCNTWCADALAAAGVPLAPAGIVTAEGVMAAARRAATPPLG